MGFRVRVRIQRPSEELLQKFRAYTTGNIVDAMNRTGAMDYRIKPLNPRWKIVGPAVTVRIRPCDNLMVYKALDVALPGDVIVISTGGYVGSSVLGDLVCLIARAKKLAGIVTDGVVRDVEGIFEVGCPVFCVGVSPNSPWKDGPGEINYPIICGGVTVNPGDIIVGDADGIVVVPQSYAKQIAGKLSNIVEKERQIEQNIKDGQFIPEWVDRLLKERGCFVEE